MSTTSAVFGDSRTHIGLRHALIAPDGQVPSSLPGVEKATAMVLISREMGARFTQLLLTFQTDGNAAFPSNETEAFAYVLRGSVRAEVPGMRASEVNGVSAFGRIGVSNPTQCGRRIPLCFSRIVQSGTTRYQPLPIRSSLGMSSCPDEIGEKQDNRECAAGLKLLKEAG